VWGDYELQQADPAWSTNLHFFEYFHGDNGKGLGASHQTGWTGLVAKLIQQHAEYTLQNRTHEVVPGLGGRSPHDRTS
jgi:hypothetical protein